jgi:hypothetical protein
MRKKLQEIKQQLRLRMHDPVPQTGAWLRSVVQSYFNYYAVPGNIDSLGLFRERVLPYWGRTLKRRSQTRRYRPPAPEAWLASSKTGHGEVETATRFPLLHTPDRGYLSSEITALH